MSAKGRQHMASPPQGTRGTPTLSLQFPGLYGRWVPLQNLRALPPSFNTADLGGDRPREGQGLA